MFITNGIHPGDRSYFFNSTIILFSTRPVSGINLFLKGHVL
jgi:hypothetical protein